MDRVSSSLRNPCVTFPKPYEEDDTALVVVCSTKAQEPESNPSSVSAFFIAARLKAQILF